MSLRDNIRESPEYQQIAAESAAEKEATQDPETVGKAVAPILSLEKGDAEFWMTAAQVVLLFLIWRELQRGA